MRLRTIITITAVALSSSTFSQDDTNRANEFGVDVTGFIRFFTTFKSSTDFYYTPTYYLTYRRLFEKGNLRSGIGGLLIDGETTGIVPDSSLYADDVGSLDFRLGWEFKSDLSKRWQVFYGLDFRTSFMSEKDELVNYNAGYAEGIERKSQIYGVAPVLGFRFRINERISLLTEASLGINYMKSDYMTTYIAQPGFPDKDNVSLPTATTIFTNYSQPISLFFVFNI